MPPRELTPAPAAPTGWPAGSAAVRASVAGVAPHAPVASSLISGEAAVLPWFLPGAAVSLAVALLVGGRVSRALSAHRAVASFLVLALGLILSATLTPVNGHLELDAVAAGSCDLSRIGPPPLGLFRSLNDASLNVLLFAPLGFAIAFLPRSRRTAAVLLAAIALPFAIETTQLLVTALARGCESADVVDNLLGLVAGLGAGLAARGLARFVLG